MRSEKYGTYVSKAAFMACCFSDSETDEEESLPRKKGKSVKGTPVKGGKGWRDEPIAHTSKFKQQLKTLDVKRGDKAETGFGRLEWGTGGGCHLGMRNPPANLR
ncbi:hypothetical protein CYMTET_25903 [Cymbomonas tetramitiformis]|uniref:Uncharacterized protein n=1 Tax=Cymbomonas tetramitiformis TaxID=36881 RepID=A0AAE0KYG5_9CHLO|nr:hypothetical protein CYMTET_25903 [Cymbomonas tetramitiformis]